MKVSVIVPVFNGADTLGVCLQALKKSQESQGFSTEPLLAELLVIDDGSTDSSAAIAVQSGATVLSTGGRCGPAVARNIAARHASGDILWFVDADVAVHPDALQRIMERFRRENDLDALMGRYDDAPSCPGFVSQFKNLMHAYVHTQGNSEAASFWCGCGAVRRTVYLAHEGLDESYARPSIEDIEFGFRLRHAGHRVALDPSIQCKHMKTWTLWNLIRTDVLLRGIPWTKLILRTRFLPNDLNLRWQQRVSTVAALMLVLLTAVSVERLAFARETPDIASLGAAASLLLVLGINRDFYTFLATRKSLGFAVASIPMHVLYFLYSGLAFVLGLGSHLLQPDPVKENMPARLPGSKREDRPEW